MMKILNEPGLSPNNGLENAFLSDQSMASRMSTLCQLVLTKIPDLRCVKDRPCQDDKAISPQEGYFRKDVS